MYKASGLVNTVSNWSKHEQNQAISFSNSIFYFKLGLLLLQQEKINQKCITKAGRWPMYQLTAHIHPGYVLSNEYASQDALDHQYCTQQVFTHSSAQ